MQILPRANVIHRIRDAVNGVATGAVAFDGDGTLWSGDVGDDLWAAALRRAAFHPRALDAMRAEARAAGVELDGDIARNLNAAYEDHRLPEERMYEIATWCFAGWTRKQVRAFCRDVLAARAQASTLHAEVVACLRWAREAGLRVLVVSASPRDIVEEAVVDLGVMHDDVLAATPLWDEDVMCTDVQRPIPYGPGKVHAIRAALGGAPLHAAFGDNAFDVPMLSLARVPVAVRPKDRLRARAAEVPALCEIAPEVA
jgi:phosphoserine phosphatase